MAKTGILKLRIDDDDRRRLERVVDYLRLTPSAVVRLLIKREFDVLEMRRLRRHRERKVPK